MTIYNIFYDSNKEIIWASNADINSDITTAEAAKGYTHVALDNDDIPSPDKFYVNSDATAVSTKTVFEPVFSTAEAAVDDVVNVTGLPIGTEVFLEGVSQGTMDNTTLTLTAKEAKNFYILVFKKDKYQDYTKKYIVKRYGA